MSKWVEGACLCGGIVFRIDPARIDLFNNCYCKNCQRNSGAGFVSQLQIPREHFEWMQGENLINQFESTPGVFRSFCSVCGSRVPTTDDRDHVPVPAGLLNEPIDRKPDVNMHLASKPDWALVDEDIACTDGQGSMAFWKELMDKKSGA